MNHGFDHFDRSTDENFVSAMLLLLLETDADARRAVCGLLRSRAPRLAGNDEPIEIGRERPLRGRNGEEGWSDLWLRFADGTLVVEVKTHDRWSVAHIEAQVARYRDGTLGNPAEPVADVVLLAPRVFGGGKPSGFVSWGEVIRVLRDLPAVGPLATRVIAHLERCVERDIGLEKGARMDVRETARQVAAIREFLKSCLLAVGGKPKDQLYTTPGNGEPLRKDGWAWHGLSIPFAAGDEAYRVGVYQYAEAPSDRQDALKHPWLEAYRERDDKLVVELPFHGSLAPADLEQLRTDFSREWAASPVVKAA